MDAYSDRISRSDPASVWIAFGHGARSAYPSWETWDAVPLQLCADWTRLGNIGPASWDRIAHIVRHEWLRAAGPGGDAAPVSTNEDNPKNP